MGSIVSYRCPSCTFSTPQLNVGWGKAGRSSFWGGLALCGRCEEIGVLNLSDTTRDRRDHRCARCNDPVKVLEGTAESIRCPRCGGTLRSSTHGVWS